MTKRPTTTQRLPTSRPGQPPRPTVPSSPSASIDKDRERRSVQAACQACRLAKVKCGNQRPKCNRCVERHLLCLYIRAPGESFYRALKRRVSSLQEEETANEELIRLMKNLPGDEANRALDRLRSGSDPSSIVSHFKSGNSLVQTAVEPETRYRYKFPCGSQKLQSSIPNNVYLKSNIYETAPLRALTVQDLTSEMQTAYTQPFHAAQIVDPLLASAKPSLWTNVCDSDVLMRALLTDFFLCEYQFTAAFHKDMFLADMARGEGAFCSSLLVNVVLGYSCVCYRGFANRVEYWNPQTLLYRFISEAKRLWELESDVPRLATIQAGMILSVFHNLCGLDTIGQMYLKHSLVLARSLRIFSISKVHGKNRPTRRKDEAHGTAFTAWALYNWETLNGFSFRFAPSLKKPPAWPLPDPTEEVAWYGELWVKYPSTPNLVPLGFGQMMLARSRFRIIMNDYCRAAYGEGLEMRLSKAYELRASLELWYNSLPGQLQPQKIVHPGQFQLHMYYFHLIITIFVCLPDAETEPKPSPQEMVSESNEYLQTLIRLYYLRHGFEAMDLFIVAPLIMTGLDCIDALQERPSAQQQEALRSMLMLVAKGLYDQRRNHFLGYLLHRVLRGRMKSEETRFLMLAADVCEDEDAPELAKEARAQLVKSAWLVRAAKGRQDVTSEMLTTLVDKFAFSASTGRYRFYSAP